MKDVMSEPKAPPRRAELFRYVALEVSDDTLTATYDLDGRTFVESVTFEGVGPLTAPAATSVAPQGTSASTVMVTGLITMMSRF